MAATMDTAGQRPPVEQTQEVMKDTAKEPEIHSALTPPASDRSRDGGSHKDHFSDDDAASSSSLSDIEMDDDLAGVGVALGFKEEGPTPPTAAKLNTPETENEAEDIYTNAQPDRIEGGVPVFCPTMEQFKDFQAYMEKVVNKWGMRTGIALVDPPEEWKRVTKDLSEAVKTIKVKNPITQGFNGTGGIWTQENMERLRSYNLPQWKALCEQSEHQPPAQRGSARAGTRSRPPPRGNAAKTRVASASEAPKPQSDAPATDFSKEDAPKEESSENREQLQADSELAAPPTPTSPSQKLTDHQEAGEGGAEGSGTAEETPTKKRNRNRKSGARSRVKASRKSAAKPGQKSGGGSGSKKTSVASRRLHNTMEVNEVNEEDFIGFEYRINTNEFDDERCAQLEQHYWKSLNFNQALYGADMPGSLFDEDTKVWNVANLPNVLDLLDQKVPGVNTAYLYLGMWKATFAWHLEDVDLYSINYIHFGAPKQWYSISQADAPKFEKAMRSIWPLEAKNCDQFLRHKCSLVSHSKLLTEFGIKVNKIVHREGQFMITFPYGYHSGFNYGYNCAESVNFALEDWLTYAQTAKKCNCEQDSVFIDIHDILRKLHPENYVDEEIEVTDYEEDAPVGLVAPVATSKSKSGQKRKRQDDKVGTAAKKVKKIKINRGFQPCILCPNSNSFDDLIMTSNGKLAHRKCASYTTETYIVEENGRDIVYGIENIHKDKWALQCNYCRQKRGVCFQCHTPKCARAYHATCAVMAGVQVDEADTPRFYEGVEYRDPIIDLRCKTHRTVKLGRPSTDSASQTQLAKTFSSAYIDYASNLKVNDVVQYQCSTSDNIIAAVIVKAYDGSGSLLVRNLSRNNKEETPAKTGIDVAWLMFVDTSNSTIPRCSANAKDMPKWLANKLLSEPDKVEAAERLPAVGDAFIDGTEPMPGQEYFLKWDEFKNRSDFENVDQKRVDIAKENMLWHYMATDSTTSKAKYCADPSKPVYDEKSEFLNSVPQPLKPVMASAMKRVSMSKVVVKASQAPSSTPSESQASANAAARLAYLEQQRRLVFQKQTPDQSPATPSNSKHSTPMSVDRDALLRQQQFLRKGSQSGHSSIPLAPSPLRAESSSAQKANATSHFSIIQPRPVSGTPLTSVFSVRPTSYQPPSSHQNRALKSAPQVENQQSGPTRSDGKPPSGMSVFSGLPDRRPGQVESASGYQVTGVGKEPSEYQTSPSDTKLKAGSEVERTNDDGQAIMNQPGTGGPAAASPKKSEAVDRIQSSINNGAVSAQQLFQQKARLPPAMTPSSISANQPASRPWIQQIPGSMTGNVLSPQGRPDHRGKPPYQSPYSHKRQSSSITDGSPIPVPNKIKSHLSLEDLGYTQRGIDGLGKDGMQAISSLLQSCEVVQHLPGSRLAGLGSTRAVAQGSDGHKKQEQGSFDPSASSISSSSVSLPASASNQCSMTKLALSTSKQTSSTSPTTSPTSTKPPSSQSRPQPKALSELSSLIKTPGGLRFVATNIEMDYGTLADDLTFVDTAAAGAGDNPPGKVRVRVKGQRKMSEHEWIESIDGLEEARLRGKLRGMGIV